MLREAKIWLPILLSLTGCRTEYHPYDTRIDGETGVNAKNCARIEAACNGKREIRFAVISDTQRWYDETEEVVRALNRRNDLDFVLHTGDIADFGMKAEFQRQRDILSRLRVPYVVLIGNHDCLATGERIFRKIFGPVDFAFTAGGVRFVCLNTNALEYGHNTPVPNFGFLEAQREAFPTEAKKTIVAMHARPYSEQFDNNVATLFQERLRKFPALQFCIHGHGHKFAEEDLFDDGVIYYECANVEKHEYLLFTLNETGYAYERMEF